MLWVAGEPEPWKSFWKSMDRDGVGAAAPVALAVGPFSDFAKPMVVFLDESESLALTEPKTVGRSPCRC